MDRALVTGGTGFIGRRLVERLVADGRRVRVLSRGQDHGVPASPVETIVGDVRDATTVARACADVDVVFHLASKVHDLSGHDDPAEHESVTVGGTRTLIEAAGLAGVHRLVFASSLAVHGPVVGGPHDEETPTRPVSPYGRAKLEAEAIVREGGDRFGMHVACLRPAMVYGPRCPGNLPRLVRLVDRGLCPQVPDFGTRRSVAYLDHVVDAFVLAAAKPVAAGRTYVVADSVAPSLRETIDIIARSLGRRPPRWTIPMWALRSAAAAGSAVSALIGTQIGFDTDDLEKLAGSAWFSAARLERELQLRPRMTLETAMPELVASLRAAS